MSLVNACRLRQAMVAIWIAICIAFQADAQTYPIKPIRLIVPLAPGGGNDTMARLVGNKLSESFGQQVIIENRPGGGSVIASEMVAQAPADGYMLYLISTSFTAAPSLHKKLPFDTLKDFAEVTRLGVVPGALTVHASLPVRSVKGLIALAKSNPGQITFGSAGIGTGSHLGGELFKFMAGVDMVHVPYRGSSPVTTALLAGEIMASFGNPVSALPHVKLGRLTILGVTSAHRWPLLPDYPSIAESGVPGYELLIWNGMAVPAATPKPIIERLHTELTKVMGRPDIVDHLAKSGSRPMVQSPAEFTAFIKNEVTKWGKVIRAAGIRVN